MGRLDGKVAIVTGAARGMGAEHARKFVAEGAKVAITDILVDEGQKLADELGENAIFVKHDVTKEEDWQNVVAVTEKAFGPVSVLVNNAGVASTVPFETGTVAEYTQVFEINELSVFIGIKTVLPSMKKAGGGSIVNISSISGIVGQIGASAYGGTKFAVRGMSKVAALELAPYGIRVNSVHPGLVRTPMIDIPEHQEILEEMAKEIPLGRIGKPEELTSVCLFLASDESGYCTGAEFVADGGFIAQ